NLSSDRKSFEVKLEASQNIFGRRAAGSPFTVYAPGNFRSENGNSEKMRSWQYALAPGGSLADSWELEHFDGTNYHLRVYGPNGFFREFIGNADEPLLSVQCQYEQGKEAGRLTGNILLNITNNGTGNYTLRFIDYGYRGKKPKEILL